jgi:uncharacterized repeat protein (TIGR03803 family)
MQSKASRSPVCTNFFLSLLTCLLTWTILSASALGQALTVLHTFSGAPTDGAGPFGQLTRDGVGNLYGTTGAGSNVKGLCVSFGGCGTAFKLDNTGKLVWMHSFTGSSGQEPLAGLLRSKAGNLYGTTVLGGDTVCYTYGCGTVFELSSIGKEKVLDKFTGGLDAQNSEAQLVEDVAGNLYGTTYMGGTSGYGTVFKIDPAGHETLLYSFAGPLGGGGDGAYAYRGVILDAAGNIYGGTSAGGAYGAGTVFEILYSFTGVADGGGPDSVLLLDAQGNLYGTTVLGGNTNCGGGSGCGVVFKLSPQVGGNWTETTLYTFCSLANCADGREPLTGPLVLDSAGNLYGTTVFGGSSPCNGSGCGVVFKLEPTGQETVLHSFSGGADGGFPNAGLVTDRSGNLYGMTGQGGNLNCPNGNGEGCGVVFKLRP